MSTYNISKALSELFDCEFVPISDQDLDVIPEDAIRVWGGQLGHTWNNGKKHSLEHIASRIKYGWSHSSETKNKIRESHLRISQEKSKRMIGNNFKLGKKESTETKDKKRQAALGKKWWHSKSLSVESFSHNCPDGFERGRLPKHSSSKSL
jgi:hypothetical protein